MRNNTMRNYMGILACAWLSVSASAFAGELKSSVVVNATAATPPADKQVSLEFVVKPNSGLVINTDGPWALELTKTSGLEVKDKTQAKANFDAKLPGFRVAATRLDPNASVDYKLTAFICTADKKQCFRDLHVVTNHKL